MKKVTNIEVENASQNDDHCDAFIAYAEYEDGTPLTEEELEKLSEDRDFVYEEASRR